MHHPEFLPPDDIVGDVAAAYVAGLPAAIATRSVRPHPDTIT